MSSALLPPNATALEKAMADAIDVALAIEAPLRDLWSPARCPADFLPWLAWTFSVDYWDAAWTEERKRAIIAESLRIHRTKGSVGSVRRLLHAAGVGGVRIVERLSARRDGSALRNGERLRTPEAWAMWRVYLRHPMTVERAAVVRALIETAQPARCHLETLQFEEAKAARDGTMLRDGTVIRGGVAFGEPIRRNGEVARDGSYSRGVL